MQSFSEFLRSNIEDGILEQLVIKDRERTVRMLKRIMKIAKKIDENQQRPSGVYILSIRIVVVQ